MEIDKNQLKKILDEQSKEYQRCLKVFFKNINSQLDILIEKVAEIRKLDSFFIKTIRICRFGKKSYFFGK